MANNKITQEEAECLLNMIKKTLSNSINFPGKGEEIEFELSGDTKKELFITKIYRGRINHKKYEIGARIKKNNILLLELHISPGKVHPNPDGTKIVGSHWHIYTEEYGRRFAYPAEDLESENFIENTILFLNKFNVIEKPTINYQLELL